MTQTKDNNKSGEVLQLHKRENAAADPSARRDTEISSDENDRDAAIISAMIGAAREWH